MAKIQEAEKKAKELVDAAQKKASTILSDAQSSAREAADKIKDAVLSKNNVELSSLQESLVKVGKNSKVATEKKVSDLKKNAESKTSGLVKDLVASVTQ